MSSIDIYQLLISKPHNSHYLNRYWKFIQSFENQIKIKGKTECHHICPKSKDLFPEYSSLSQYKWNAVHLTPRQHFIAHMILSKTYGGCQIFAYWAMCHKWSNNYNRNYKINSHMFNKIKIEYKERNVLTNPFNNPQIQEEIKQTIFKIYNVYNIFQNEEIKEKSRQTKLKKYGNEYYNNTEKAKKTRIENNNGNFWSAEQLEKQKQTNLQKTCYEYISQVPEIKEQKLQTNLKNHGVEYPMQCVLIQEKSKQTRYEKNNGKYASDEELKKKQHTMLLKTGFTHNSKIPFLSIIETKHTYNKASISRKYPELKKYY